MLQSLFRRAEATVDNAIAGVLTRALVAIPFIVAIGFGTAGVAIYVYRELGSANGNLAMAALFTVVGLITAAVIAVRYKSGTTTNGQAVEPEKGEQAGSEAALLDPVDREVVAAALTVIGPLVAPMLLRTLLRNLPLIAAVTAAGFVLSRQTGTEQEGPMQPAE